jgi:hypothetical protein
MRLSNIEIETWTRRVVRVIREGKKFEDDNVELKRELIADKNKAARRIAGHANAAGGPNVLWIIGIDESNGQITSAINEPDLATWWQSVQSQFSEWAPSMQSLLIPLEDGSHVMALVFDATRKPYVVKIENGGGMATAATLEVPWREGTRTTSAKRGHLFDLLAAPQPELKFEWLSAELTSKGQMQGNVPYAYCDFSLNLHSYLEVSTTADCALPQHRVKALLRFPEVNFETPLRGVTFVAPQSGPVSSADGQVLITGPGKLTMQFRGSGAFDGPVHFLEDAQIALDIDPVNAAATHLTIDLVKRTVTTEYVDAEWGLQLNG